MNNFLVFLSFLLVRLLSLLPMAILSILGNILGVIGFYSVKKRRNIGVKNLSLCFPELSDIDKNKIIKEHFKYLMTSALEYSLLFFASYNRIRHIVKVNNLEIIDKYYGKKPIILISPHFVGLDLAASRLSQDYIGYGLYSQQKNSQITDRLKDARIRFMKDRGGELFLRNDGLRPVIKKLRETKAIFYYLPDQDFGERDSLYVPFFAHPNCATVNILPRLVKMIDAVVIPMAVYRVGNHYEVEFSAAWDNYPTDNRYNDTIKINQSIEVAISKNIAQYFWLHKRFKSQPNCERGSIYS
ncbi:MAG: lysophospholipid acyltransferase family protein [Burkholderiales bacterium]|nr:lysophospholipid acyltransferase family protein [Burkholderiales bacterium]